MINYTFAHRTLRKLQCILRCMERNPTISEQLFFDGKPQFSQDQTIVTWDHCCDNIVLWSRPALSAAVRADMSMKICVIAAGRWYERRAKYVHYDDLPSTYFIREPAWAVLEHNDMSSSFKHGVREYDCLPRPGRCCSRSWRGFHSDGDFLFSAIIRYYRCIRGEKLESFVWLTCYAFTSNTHWALTSHLSKFLGESAKKKRTLWKHEC